jgi:hypothetical protein
MKRKDLVVSEGDSRNIIIFRDGKNNPKVEVLFHQNMLWLKQGQIAELFDVKIPAISKHLKNIFEDGELVENSVVSILETTASDGKNYSTNFYNIDAIIAVGYRINSQRAIIFRNWATNILREYIQKGSVLDMERLKQPEYIFGQDYFDETLERIRDIRSSERRFYQKITDIYAQCSADYEPDNEITRNFYATVQNKLHWAIHRHTAAEVILQRASHKKANMGLTTWKNAPSGKIRKHDVSVAKNYLNEKEISNLNSIVSMYLDYAERQAKKRVAMYMKDWVLKLDAFLQFNDEAILNDFGKVTHEIAKSFAEKEFEKFKILEDKKYISDFDKFILLENETKK